MYVPVCVGGAPAMLYMCRSEENFQKLLLLFLQHARTKFRSSGLLARQVHLLSC